MQRHTFYQHPHDCYRLVGNLWVPYGQAFGQEKRPRTMKQKNQFVQQEEGEGGKSYAEEVLEEQMAVDTGGEMREAGTDCGSEMRTTREWDDEETEEGDATYVGTEVEKEFTSEEKDCWDEEAVTGPAAGLSEEKQWGDRHRNVAEGQNMEKPFIQYSALENDEIAFELARILIEENMSYRVMNRLLAVISKAVCHVCLVLNVNLH
jgi:hypothetical protein